MGCDNRLMELAEYQIGFDTLNNNNENTILVHLSYPKGWKIIEPENNIKIYQDGYVVYYWIDKCVDINPIIDLIDETINLNKDLEARFALLNQKINELKELFVDKDLCDLQRLQFTFPEKCIVAEEKPKKKSRKKKDELKSNKKDKIEKNNNTVCETVIEPNEMNDDVNENELSLIDRKISEAVANKTHENYRS